ncbi:hypothetical protein KC359_g47 [Hortaea werneckii]|nr:hypothetical protein KC359_g47 [Hortaea werneckii]
MCEISPSRSSRSSSSGSGAVSTASGLAFSAIAMSNAPPGGGVDERSDEGRLLVIPQGYFFQDRYRDAECAYIFSGKQPSSQHSPHIIAKTDGPRLGRDGRSALSISVWKQPIIGFFMGHLPQVSHVITCLRTMKVISTSLS